MGRIDRTNVTFWLVQRVDTMCYSSRDCTWTSDHRLARLYNWGNLSWTLRLNGREVWVQATGAGSPETYLVRRLTCQLPRQWLKMRKGALDRDSVQDALVRLEAPQEWSELPDHWYGLNELKPFLKRNR